MYNTDARPLARELLRQAQAIGDLDFELLVVDDCSTDGSLVARCAEISQWPHGRFKALEANIGRARIRNLLASLATKEWLLFLDCDMVIDRPDFLRTYLQADGDVIYGGYSVGPGEPSSLRWLYEQAHAAEHTAEARRRRPYQHFHTGNFLVRRDIMLAHPFDATFSRYGYEDVLFGKQLREAGIAISHIDNPAAFKTFESNASFVGKTEEALLTLAEHRRQLRGYSRLLTVAEGIHIAPIRWLLRSLHRLVRRPVRRRLCGTHPNLRLFELYKTGHFLTILPTVEQS